MTYRFCVSLHARPGGVAAGELVELRGARYPTLAVDPASLGRMLPVSFETSAAALEKLPRMLLEGDGSLVWVSPPQSPRWQVDGLLHDGGRGLLWAELNGTCPRDCFDQLLTALGWPATPLIFQLVLAGVFLDEATFRRYAAAAK